MEETEVVDSGFVEDSLYSMSDEALDAAFAAAKAEMRSPEVGQEAKVEIEAEQPVENVDSDNDGEQETVEVDTAVDEPTEVDVETDEAEAVEEPQPAQKRVYKANGQEFAFSDEEIFEQFGAMFGKAMNYTQKMQAMKPYRGIVELAKEHGLTQEDVSLMVDVLKGNKEAITAVLKRTGVDTLDLDTEKESAYRPKNYGRSETELAIQEVVEEISNDPEYAVTHHVIEKQWDDKSRQMFAKDPSLIRELHKDVRNGVFDKVNAEMLKLKVVDGGRLSDMDYYIEAGKRYYAQQRLENTRKLEAQQKEAAEAARKVEAEKLAAVKAKDVQRAEVSKASDKRKAAAPVTSRAGKKDVLDYLDDSDENFDKWYKDLQDKM